MVYEPDMTQRGSLRLVGYLSREHDYPQGETSEAAFDCLANLVMQHILSYLGCHDCDLGSCSLNQGHPELYWRGLKIPRGCNTDILVPAETVVYMAPALILHYIRAHQYLPPVCFLEAVLACPEAGSKQYLSAIKKIAPYFAWLVPRGPYQESNGKLYGSL
jgi:hypothetical protein